jgi:undecaprenyl-diphosphatase
MIKNILQGIVQGLTEFLPVSSSGHLLFIQNLINLKENNLIMDVLLHIPSFLVIIIFFFNDIKNIILGLFNSNSRKKSLKIILLIIIGNIPAGIFGIIVKKFYSGVFENINVLIFTWSLTAIFLILSDKFKNNFRKLEDINLKDAIIIGISQAIAVLPGISRSGFTITTAIFLGIEREDSAKFSFLLGLPAMLGAFLIEILTLKSYIIINKQIFIGLIASFLASLFGIIFLFKMLKNVKLKFFGFYLLILVIITIILKFI